MHKDHLHSLRVAYENWVDPDRLEHLLRLLTMYPAGITQIALFTTSVHIPLTLTELTRRAQILKERMETIRNAGFSAGINILTTIGHHCEDLDAGLGERYPFMTSVHGEVCRGSYCMRGEAYLEEYVIPCYKILAQAEPDFIWVDDDVRYGHMPIGNGCFCDHCIESFNRKQGSAYTRSTLRSALNEQNIPLRKAWLDHNSDAICGLFRVIGKTVREINPSITLGFMTGERYFEGYQFANYAEALSVNGTYEIMWRPGGGAYEDTNYDLILEKQEQLGRQNAYLPDYVTLIHSEIENFPYQLLKKTPKSTAMEAAMSMTVGCSGAAFNILPSETGESLDRIIPHLRAINGLTDFYRTTQRLLKGLSPEGIHTGWRIDSQAAVPEGEFVDAYGGMYAAYNRELFSFGLPECYHKDKANVVTLHGDAAAVMADEEVTSLLTGGVYLDAGALKHLQARGFGDLLGFGVDREIPVDAREVYTDDILNEGITGGIRNCRQAFNLGDSFAFSMLSPKCRSLCALNDYHDRQWAECCCGIYENSVGGRVCAAGYYPHSWISDYQKTIQLKRLFVWLSNGTLPSFVDSYHRVRNITLTGNGRTCVTLFNRSNDDIDTLQLAVHTDKTEAQLYTMYHGQKTLTAYKHEKHCGETYQYFTVDHIPPYEGVIIAL